MKFEDMTADLESQAISGYLPSGRYVKIPLISHIVDNLYVGGHSAHADLGDFFSHVFSFYVFEDPYTTGPDTVHEGFHMYDSSHVDATTLNDAVVKIVDALNQGGNVLVHCQAGINRSNLAAASVLRKWRNLTSAEAIDMLREKRDVIVLSNRTFEEYLRNLDEVVQ